MANSVMSSTPSSFTPPQLIAHGQHVRPAYEGGAAGHSTGEDRPEAAVHGTLARFDKRTRAATIPQAFGWIKATYADAVEYSGQKQALAERGDEN